MEDKLRELCRQIIDKLPSKRLSEAYEWLYELNEYYEKKELKNPSDKVTISRPAKIGRRDAQEDIDKALKSGRVGDWELDATPKYMGEPDII